MEKFRHTLIERILLKFPKFTKRILNYVFRNKFGKVLNDLKEKKIEIKYVYDIGANKGDWSNFYKQTSLRGSNFYLFEANEIHKKYLEKKNFNFFIEILSDKVKTVDFYNNNNSTGDSYFKETTGNHEGLIPQKRKTTTLNQIVEKNNLPLPHLIKIDTQGSEIDILKGSDRVLKNCKILYLECPISANFNENNFKISDYVSFVKDLGFIPHDINQIHHYHGFLTHLDIMFVRKELHKEIGLNLSLLKSFY
jgi:FkbM family methyltransferase|tara:strand:- start:1796 stop:2548 length:753 start_codon:yes stop_codon:yes gene_type:complete